MNNDVLNDADTSISLNLQTAGEKETSQRRAETTESTAPAGVTHKRGETSTTLAYDETPMTGGDEEAPDPDNRAHEDDLVLPLPDDYTSPIGERVDAEISTISEMFSMVHGDYTKISKLVEQLDSTSAENEMMKEIIQKVGPRKAVEWLGAVVSGVDHLVYKGGFDTLITDANADWRQGISFNGGLAVDGRPRIKNDSDGEEPSQTRRLTGRAAMVRARSIMRIGDYLTISLPHTGIWVTLLISGDDELVDFRTRVFSEKAVLGRRTVGLVFSNTNVIIAKHEIDFLLNMVVDSSLGITDKTKLMDIILEPDLDMLAHGYLMGRYRSGYTMTQPCLSNPSTCNHVEVSKVMFPRMKIIDNAKLTPAQKKHMWQRTGHKLGDVVAYQQTLLTLADNEYTLNSASGQHVKVIFGIPNLKDKVEYGSAWIDGITDAVELAFDKQLNGDQRNDLITRKAAATNMRTYAHWVRTIKYDDGFVEGREDVFSTLLELNRDDAARESFYKAVNEFINRVTVAIVALPRDECPECKARPPMIMGSFPAFTPLNVGKTFFTLMTNTVQKSYDVSDI